uniref:V-type proton ATPase subunit D-like n=1 Tax=Dermatophagoides pteronyssinus TaxID=6956 RepID=A0A6P6Y577_DERPT|nr:V-type proton ATPase subunit D-like [Dermatophagoides pteronyssinus]
MLQQFTQKLKSAAQGHSLLKTKMDALTMRRRALQRELAESRVVLNEELRNGFLELARTNFNVEVTYPWKQKILSSELEPTVLLSSETELIAGVRIVNLKIVREKNANKSGHWSLLRGFQNLRRTSEIFGKVVLMIAQLASMQANLANLAKQIKVTNRRVNALESIVIPRYEESISYIGKELDEQEREDFYRMKKIQKLKRNKGLADA